MIGLLMLIFPIPSVCENAEDKADEGDYAQINPTAAYPYPT